MSEPIEKVAERVLAVHNAPRRLNRPYMEQIYESEGRSELYRESAPALAREVLALRKLCGVMGEALEGLRLDEAMEYEGRIDASAHFSCDALNEARAALAQYAAHFTEPNPAEPKEK